MACQALNPTPTRPPALTPGNSCTTTMLLTSSHPPTHPLTCTHPLTHTPSPAFTTGNFCATIRGDDPPGLDRGHGRLVVARFHLHPASKGVPEECGWNVTQVIDLPEAAFFLDYAGAGLGPRVWAPGFKV